VRRSRRLAIPPAVLQAIVRHARRERPRECCGFLVGARRRVAFAVGTRNVAPGHSRYRIDDRAHIALRRTLRRFSPPLEILGIYHSHPSGDARPSRTDIAEAFYPDWTYVIVGLGRAADVRAYRLARGRADRVVINASREIVSSAPRAAGREGWWIGGGEDRRGS
jgi:proteasome lid subunit RPN8/RPN11